jgi:hypothetical protein
LRERKRERQREIERETTIEAQSRETLVCLIWKLLATTIRRKRKTESREWQQRMMRVMVTASGAGDKSCSLRDGVHLTTVAVKAGLPGSFPQLLLQVLS